MNSISLLALSLEAGITAFVLMGLATILSWLLSTWLDKSALFFGCVIAAIFALLLARYGWDYMFYEGRNFSIPNQLNEAQLFGLLKATFIGGAIGIGAGLFGKTWMESRRY